MPMYSMPVHWAWHLHIRARNPQTIHSASGAGHQDQPVGSSCFVLPSSIQRAASDWCNVFVQIRPAILAAVPFFTRLAHELLQCGILGNISQQRTGHLVFRGDDLPAEIASFSEVHPASAGPAGDQTHLCGSSLSRVFWVFCYVCVDFM